MRYKMLISYDGNYFKGSQRQKGLKTVQGEIEKILTKINNSSVKLTFCGRTDAGVHALNSVVHFDLDKDVKLYNLRKALNNGLNKEIYVKKIEPASDTFHARYDCISKEYRYFVNIGDFDLFQKNYVFQYNKSLSISKMHKALKLLEGEHDFRVFCADNKEKENCVRKIIKTNVIKKNKIVEITIIGNGFLKHMVRNIVSILIEIGGNQKDINYLQCLLNKEINQKSIKPALSCGLYLWNIKYK